VHALEWTGKAKIHRINTGNNVDLHNGRTRGTWYDDYPLEKKTLAAGG
jgi:hypothetical protein